MLFRTAISTHTPADQDREPEHVLHDKGACAHCDGDAGKLRRLAAEKPDRSKNGRNPGKTRTGNQQQTIRIPPGGRWRRCGRRLSRQGALGARPDFGGDFADDRGSASVFLNEGTRDLQRHDDEGDGPGDKGHQTPDRPVLKIR